MGAESRGSFSKVIRQEFIVEDPLVSKFFRPEAILTLEEKERIKEILEEEGRNVRKYRWALEQVGSKPDEDTPHAILVAAAKAVEPLFQASLTENGIVDEADKYIATYILEKSPDEISEEQAKLFLNRSRVTIPVRLGQHPSRQILDPVTAIALSTLHSAPQTDANLGGIRRYGARRILSLKHNDGRNSLLVKREELFSGNPLVLTPNPSR